MEQEVFIEKVAAQFEDVESSSINLNTKFRDIEGWSSFVALSLIAMADEEFNIKLRGEDIRKAETVGDLYLLIQTKGN